MLNKRMMPLVGAGMLATLAASTAMSPSRAAVSAIRNDADPTKLLNDLKSAWETFKQEQTNAMAALKQDVVQTEKIERINASISELQAAVNAQAAKMAAAAVGPNGGTPVSAEQKTYNDAFNRYFRSAEGNVKQLHDLAVKAAMTTDSQPDGGALVTPEMESTIDRVLGTVSAIRSLSRVVNISTGEYKKLVSLGGATSGWVGEKEARPQTNTPRLSELSFNAMELYAMPAATQTMLDDARVDIAQWLGDEVAITFAEQEGAAFAVGDGNKKPLGIFAHDKIADGGAAHAWGKLGFVVSGAAANFAADPAGLDALIRVQTALKQGYRPNASWLMNRSTEGAVRLLKDSQGRYQWEPSAKVGTPATLLGYPITTDDNIADIAAGAYPIAFGDFRRGYLIVDRYGVRVLVDPYTNKPYVMFYTTKRVGGGVQDYHAIKLLKIST